jgi:hypothetical protein
VRHELLVPDLRSGGGVELLAGATPTNQIEATFRLRSMPLFCIIPNHLNTSLCYALEIKNDTPFGFLYGPTKRVEMLHDAS